MHRGGFIHNNCVCIRLKREFVSGVTMHIAAFFVFTPAGMVRPTYVRSWLPPRGSRFFQDFMITSRGMGQSSPGLQDH